MLGVQFFVVNEIPEDGTLVPEHVGVDTSYEVCLIMFYCILISAFCSFRVWNVRECTDTEVSGSISGATRFSE